MIYGVRFARSTLLRRTAVALAVAACSAAASAQALPPFTFNPGAAGLNGATFSADNFQISDYATVTLSGSTFTETGYLAVGQFQSGAAFINPTGLNSTYGLYFQFNGSGTVNAGNPATTPTTGTFNTLNYTLYGYNGTASFGFAGNTPTETATGEIVLATGSLLPGSFISTAPDAAGSFFANAGAKLSFNVAPGAAGFFQSPNPFYNMAMTSFTNTPSQIQAFDGGFRIRQGGGSVNFVSTVPEPETYALLLAGLGVVGFVARRRRG